MYWTHGKILLVGKDKEKSIPQLVLVEHALQFLTSLDNTIAIVGVHNEDDTLGVLEVMSPQRTNFVLTADIPHGKLNVLVLDSLDVEACYNISMTSRLLKGLQQSIKLHEQGRSRRGLSTHQLWG